ncbi:ROK family protein [Bacillus massiliigorillae]|uniref:ROK family protein n=1 Tax=Bacillus massiliigorillae TaxID=1243664 RepID=UPI00039FAE32|nr:ROK family protein [Bacillus massiliigorillae]
MNNVPYNTNKVKQINTDLVKNILKNQEHATKAYIAQHTGLSVATCGNILKELIQTGEVIEMELGESKGGRPPRNYAYNANYSYIACLYMSNEGEENTLTYAIANLIGEIIEEDALKCEVIDFNMLDSFIGSILEKYSIIKAIGIGVPGVVNKGKIGVCDIEELIDFPLESQLKAKYDVEFIIENDMNCSVFGMYKNETENQPHSMAVMSFQKRNFPGSGMIVDGKIVRGFSTFAGEISFLPFGISREEQFKQLHQEETFLPLVVKSIISLIAILNPEQIALTGGLCKAKHLSTIIEECKKMIPNEHMPTITLIENIRTAYVQGLILLTLERLTYQLQLVEKKI